MCLIVSIKRHHDYERLDIHIPRTMVSSNRKVAMRSPIRAAVNVEGLQWRLWFCKAFTHRNPHNFQGK